MACLTTERRARLQTQITALETQLDNINATLIEMATKGVSEYDWQDGGGRQKVRRISLKDLQSLSERLESSLERNYRILNGTGNPKINLKTY